MANLPLPTIELVPRDSAGAPVGTPATVPVLPAMWPHVSAALTLRKRGQPSLDSIVAEMALLWHHLDHAPHAPLAMTRAYETAPPHLATFLTEATALALTGQLGSYYGARPWWPMLNLDALPSKHFSGLKGRPKGPFPDIAFLIANRIVVAESRGRRARPISLPSNAAPDETGRLSTLASDWYPHVPGHLTPQWYMAWMWLNRSGTVVHFYDPGEPVVIGEQAAAAFRGAWDGRFDAIRAATSQADTGVVELFGRGAFAAGALLDELVDTRSGARSARWILCFLAQERFAVPGPPFGPEALVSARVPSSAAALAGSLETLLSEPEAPPDGSDEPSRQHSRLVDRAVSEHLAVLVTDTDDGEPPSLAEVELLLRQQQPPPGTLVPQLLM